MTIYTANSSKIFLHYYLTILLLSNKFMMKTIYLKQNLLYVFVGSYMLYKEINQLFHICQLLYHDRFSNLTLAYLVSF